MSNPVIRRAEAGDAAALALLMNQLGYPTEPGDMERRLEAILSHDDYETFVAVSSDRVVGMAGIVLGHFYERNGIYGRLLALAVSRHWRGKGIGRALVQRTEEWLRERGARLVIVQSGKQRGGAHAFYERLGFKATGLRFVKEL